MESIGGSGYIVVGCIVRKKRSNVSRRPRPDSQPLPDSDNLLPVSSTPPLGSGRNDENPNVGGSIVVSDRLGSENKPKKLKLKVGGVTRTVHTKSTLSSAFGGGSSATNSSCSSDAPWPRQKLILQENMVTSYSCHPDKGKRFQGVPLKEFSGSGSSVGKEHSSRGNMSGESISLNETYQYESVRKSKRVPKRRILDVGLDDGDEDEEIRYLGRLNASKVAADYEDEEEEGSEKKRGISKVSESSPMDDDMYDMDYYRSPRLGKESRKKTRSEKIYEDKDYMEEEEPTSDYEPNAKRKKSRKESLDLFIDGRKELTLVTHQQALQSGKDVLSDSGASLIDLPNGLPLAPPKKQKEKLSEVEQQLKKAEVAQRRRMQSEKAAREAEAETIRKILGQDSGRKKREEKMKQQRDESARRKAENNGSLASNTIRWVMGPTGTVVIFSEDIGLPNIFNPVTCSYPPPREKCVGPNCTNSYKYRDSESKLPLCSLHCYRAIHEKMQPFIAC